MSLHTTDLVAHVGGIFICEEINVYNYVYCVK